MIDAVVASSAAVPDGCVFVSPDSPFAGWSWMWITFRDGAAAALLVVVAPGRPARDQVCVSRARWGQRKGKVQCASFQAAVDNLEVFQVGTSSTGNADAAVWVVCLGPRAQAAAGAIAAVFGDCGRLDLWVNGVVLLAWEEDAECAPPCLPISDSDVKLRVEVLRASYLHRKVLVFASWQDAEVAEQIAACVRACGDVVECVWGETGEGEVLRVIVGLECVFGSPDAPTSTDTMPSPSPPAVLSPVGPVSLRLTPSREAGFCLIPDKDGLLSRALGLDLGRVQQLLVRS